MHHGRIETGSVTTPGGTRPPARVSAVADYGPGMRLFALILFAMGASLCGVTIAESRPLDREDLWQGAVLIVLLGLPSACFVAETVGVSIEVDASGIRTRSPWRRPRTIPWGDVERVDYSAAARWYRIHTRSHGVVRLHDYLRGRRRVMHFVNAVIDAR